MSLPELLMQNYLEIPPITRVYTTLCVLLTTLVHLNFVSPFQIYFNPILIINKLQVISMYMYMTFG